MGFHSQQFAEMTVSWRGKFPSCGPQPQGGALIPGCLCVATCLQRHRQQALPRCGHSGLSGSCPAPALVAPRGQGLSTPTPVSPTCRLPDAWLGGAGHFPRKDCPAQAGTETAALGVKGTELRIPSSGEGGKERGKLPPGAGAPGPSRPRNVEAVTFS